MPAVHSRRVHLARFSSESYTIWDCVSVTFYTLAVNCQSTRSESKASAYIQEWEYIAYVGETIKNKDEYMSESDLILVCDTRQQPGETRDPLTLTSWTTKNARHERLGLHRSIRGDVSIYILALALSRVLPARVYSRHKIFLEFLIYNEYLKKRVLNVVQEKNTTWRAAK